MGILGFWIHFKEGFENVFFFERKTGKIIENFMEFIILKDKKLFSDYTR